ncbi:MAG: bifunctional ornithine acetyltransferase/N-acetylglutamate synthase, partial [archaeon]|nr:bifunctional ornithine acetyltransferase/N-acetylglutamate synthase [archaeon]
MKDYIRYIDGGLCAISDIEASGARKGKYGVSVILTKGSTASGVFTSNKVVAASVKYTQKVLENGIISAVVANSGNANCFTGEQGIKDCESLVELVSEKLDIDKNEIAIASTGVIG